MNPSIVFRITNATLMDRVYPEALAYVKIEGVISMSQKCYWKLKFGQKWYGKTEFLIAKSIIKTKKKTRREIEKKNT